jgi:hypothetical protein
MEQSDLAEIRVERRISHVGRVARGCFTLPVTKHVTGHSMPMASKITRFLTPDEIAQVADQEHEMPRR